MHLYFSDKLKSQYPTFNASLESVLKQYDIAYGYLENTKDIWARDYMPVAINKTSFVQFRYEPDYLQEDLDLQTLAYEVTHTLDLYVKPSDINFDGGNIVKHGKIAIITSRLAKEYEGVNTKALYKQLKEELELDELIIIPDLDALVDMTGHADGMVRFIDKKNVLLNSFHPRDSKLKAYVQKKLQGAGLKVHELTLDKGFYKKQEWAPYINFIELKDYLIVPTLNDKKYDDLVILCLEKLFKNKKVLALDSREIIKEGGALNCISWEKENTDG